MLLVKQLNLTAVQTARAENAEEDLVTMQACVRASLSVCDGFL